MMQRTVSMHLKTHVDFLPKSPYAVKIIISITLTISVSHVLYCVQFLQQQKIKAL